MQLGLRLHLSGRDHALLHEQLVDGQGTPGPGAQVLVGPDSLVGLVMAGAHGASLAKR